VYTDVSCMEIKTEADSNDAMECLKSADLSSFITPEGSKIIQIKHLKHKITQQYHSLRGSAALL